MPVVKHELPLEALWWTSSVSKRRRTVVSVLAVSR
jgi:hypothetical protein